MNAIVKTLTVALVFSIFTTSTAAADEDGFTVKFPYDPAAGIEANREVFEKVASRACRNVAWGYVGLAKISIRRECQADLVAKATAIAMEREGASQFAKND